MRLPSGLKITKMAALAALAGLSACATPTRPIEVTRFHIADAQTAIPMGSITIEPTLDAAGKPILITTLEERTYAAAVLRELQRVGYQPAENALSDTQYLVAVTLDVTRTPAADRRSPVSVGVGGSTGSYGSGVGLGVGIDLSGPPKDVIVTQLSVRIREREGRSSIWEGRAILEAKDGSPAAQPGLAAARVAAALFKDFPGTSGATIMVP